MGPRLDARSSDHPLHASLFAVSGVQNFSCNPATGAYKFQGWLVNGTDFNTGKHAGAQSHCWSLGETGIVRSGYHVESALARLRCAPAGI